MIECGTGMPTPVTVSRKSSRSSARLIASRSAPISSMPLAAASGASSTARFSAVCPPSVGRIASGCSRSMISATVSASSGSR